MHRFLHKNYAPLLEEEAVIRCATKTMLLGRDTVTTSRVGEWEEGAWRRCQPSYSGKLQRL